LSDYVCGGDLSRFVAALKTNVRIEGFDFIHKFKMAYVMAKTLSYLHSRQILYRGLKTANWVVDAELLPLLIDFGSARDLSKDGRAPVSELTYPVGTRIYNPPELLNEEKVREFLDRKPNHETVCKIDIYSFAMVLYELFMEERPFDEYQGLSQQEIEHKILESARPVFSDASEGSCVQQLCERCWCELPEDRPTMEEVIEDLKELGEQKGGTHFVEFVAIWEEKVRGPECVHGTEENLRECARRGIPRAEYILRKFSESEESFE
jgi:serine/threonine protein kinase